MLNYNYSTKNVSVEYGPLAVTASSSQKLCRRIMTKLKDMLKDAALKEVFTEVAHKFLWNNWVLTHSQNSLSLRQGHFIPCHSSLTITPPSKSLDLTLQVLEHLYFISCTNVGIEIMEVKLNYFANCNCWRRNPQMLWEGNNIMAVSPSSQDPCNCSW